jgi:CBS domain-containing protein
LPKGTVEELLKDIPKLKAVLTYHVTPGKLMAADIVKLKRVKTVQGQEVKIDASKWHLHKNVKVNDANIIKADVVADNGVIHIIDKLILPKESARVLSYVVKDYMIKEINTVNYDATVTDGAKVMATDENAEGYAIVLKNGMPVGIVTERDIVNRALAKDLDPSKIKISEIMSSPLVTVDPDDDLLKASKLMQERNVRKLVVMRDEIAYGIITADNIAQHCGDYVDRSIRDIIRWTAPLGM